MSDRSLQIEELESSLPSELLWGAFRVKETRGSRMVLVGWVLGIDSQVQTVQILARGKVVASTSPRLPRADIAEQFPERGEAKNCGFELSLEANGRGQSILVVEALMEDGVAAPMGEIRALAPRRWADVLRRH